MEIEVESVSLTVEALCQGMTDIYNIPTIVIGDGSQVVTGSWNDSKKLVDFIVIKTGLNLIKKDGVFILSNEESDLRFVEWASGRSREDTLSILSGLGIGEKSFVDSTGIAYIGVSPDKVDSTKELIAGLESGDDWLVQITVVDGSVNDTMSASANVPSKQFGGGWSVGGSNAVDSYLFTIQSGAERVQSFGSRVPFRTSTVTEQGVFLSGSVEYQELTSELAVEIIESSKAPKARVRVVTRKPGAERDGLFEILDETIDTEVFIRPEPVRVGVLKRWQGNNQNDLSWPLSVFNRGYRSRVYSIWFHAVRLPRPVGENEDEQIKFEPKAVSSPLPKMQPGEESATSEAMPGVFGEDQSGA